MGKLLTILLLFTFGMGDNSYAKGVVEITPARKVEMYTALFWAPCKEAKALLQSRGIEFESHMITFSRRTAEKMEKRTDGKTFVPQKMVDDHYFGGLVELKTYFNNKPVTE